MSRSGGRSGYSIQDLHKVNKVEFSLLSKTEIIDMGVCEVTEKKLYTDETFEPYNNGLNDLRMGTSQLRTRCKTCFGTISECCGHFGYIKLSQPVYHHGYLGFLKKILTCVCDKCGRLLMKKEEKEQIKKIKNPEKRLRECVRKCGSTKECKPPKDGDAKDSYEGCGRYNPKYKIDDKDPLKITETPTESNEEETLMGKTLWPEKALEIIKKIRIEDVEILGFDPEKCHPQNFIIEYLIVAPPPVRPAVSMNAVNKSEDDLTNHYMQILKINKQIKDKQANGNSFEFIEPDVTQLQTLVATLMNNEINRVKQSTTKSGKPVKSISERLKGKEGRLRKNLMGKRVDFSARTVVSPDPNLSVDELGVPKSIALNLTFPETVTPLNKAILQKRVENGPNEWPGAKVVRMNDGKEMDLRFCQNRKDFELNYGCVVERHLVDGDYVVFNRQPSLHRMSMMGHKIRILPYSSFRLNLSVTTPYNADFDGDEMNMHVPQTFESKAEIKEIMHVPNQIVTPQNNKPVMGIVQDSLLGIRLMTRRNTFLTKDQVMNLLLWIENVEDFNGDIPMPAILKPVPLWTGKQIISLILPDVNLNKTNSVHKKEDNNALPLRDTRVLIEKGQLIMGILDKSIVGSTSGGLLHYIWLDKGPKKAGDFLTNAQKVVNNWLLINGFTVGVSDIFPDKESNVAMSEELNKAENIVTNLLTKALKGDLEKHLGKSIFQFLEDHVNPSLNNVFKEASQKAQDMMNDKNNIYNMVAAGSKGSHLNIAQIMACVGQQNVEGKRIPYGFRNRTLPHFCKDDFSPESRGFVKNSYLTGLRPEEFFFHAMGGREGLIDTAVKTSETGYLQRRLVKCLEDVMVKYDGTVRDCSGNVIQFIYGEDGMMGEYIEGFTQNLIDMKDEDFFRDYRYFDPEDDEDLVSYFTKNTDKFDSSLVKVLIEGSEEELRAKKAILEEEFETLREYRDELRRIFPNFEGRVYLPVNVPRLIQTVKNNTRKRRKLKEKCTLNPFEAKKLVDELIDRLIICPGDDAISKEHQESGIYFLKIILRYYLNSKWLGLREGVDMDMLKVIVGEVEVKFNKAKAFPGEMVGVIAAQSLGEPTTQMTLNTFHFAGVSSKNVTLGVPRLKEILNVTKKIKTPSMIIYINPQYLEETNDEVYTRDFLKLIQAQLEYTTLKHLCKLTEIYYDPDPRSSVIPEDREIVENYYTFDEDEDVILSPWLLRFVLELNALIDRKIEKKQIKKRIETSAEGIIQVIINEVVDDPSPQIRIKHKFKSESDRNNPKNVDNLMQLEQSLLDLHLKGNNNIHKVFMKKNDKKRKVVDEKGEIKALDEWVLETEGSDLKSILAMDLYDSNSDQYQDIPTYLDVIDKRRTITNNSYEVYEFLGIEAARQSLLREIRGVLDVYGIYVNYRHLATLCDVMTSRGNLDSLTRHGINRVIDGPFRRASFEQTVEVLFEAGIFNKVQHFQGITENIMFGQLAPLGTGGFEILLDKSKLKDARYIPDKNVGPDGNEIELEDFDPKILRTPSNNIGQTPIHHSMGATPLMSVRTPNNYEGNFTPAPYPSVSPIYNPTEISTPRNNTTKQSYQSPVYQPVSPGSPNYSNSSVHSSPRNPNYSPSSPTYNSGMSPTYSSGNQSYSPASPSYSMSSPKSPMYNNSQSRSPSSPNYSTSPYSNTPSSSPGHHSVRYSPHSPAYNKSHQPNSPVYNTATRTDPVLKQPTSEIEETREYSEEEDEDN